MAFTGSLPTAKKIQSNLIENQSEIIPLIAETGGINAMIVDSSALLEQVTDDVIRSAFDSAGQRCSALRILCIQEEIYNDLIEMVKGNMLAQKIGDTNNFDSDIGPIINKRALDDLNRYITDCHEKGMDVFQSHSNTEDPYLSPTLVTIDKISNIQKEQFGPILHVLRYSSNDIEELIEQINTSGYGLTLGVHTRIESRADYFAKKLKVGNIYINREHNIDYIFMVAAVADYIIPNPQENKIKRKDSTLNIKFSKAPDLIQEISSKTDAKLIRFF